MIWQLLEDTSVCGAMHIIAITVYLNKCATVEQKWRRIKKNGGRSEINKKKRGEVGLSFDERE